MGGKAGLGAPWGEGALAYASERRVVEASLDGDLEAFAELYDKYRPQVFSVCLSRLRNHALAEDATQDTFVRAFTHFASFDPSMRVWPWLVTIAHRRCTDICRRKTRISSLDEALETDDEEEILPQPDIDTTFEAVVRIEERTRLQKAIGTLPPHQRRALLLHALEGWNYAEIASVERISVGSVRGLLARARARVRKLT